MEFIQSQTWEFKRSSSLRFLGALISLNHIFTYFLWFYGSTSVTAQYNTGSALCWGFFPSCGQFQVFLTQEWVFISYLVAAITTFILFSLGRGLGLAWILSIFTFFVQLITYFLDFNLADNIYALMLFLQPAVLFFPSKHHITRYLIVTFYLASGIQKMNSDWLSGYWLKDSLPLTDKGLEWSAAFSVFMEMLMPIVLLSKVGSRVAWSSVIFLGYLAFQWYVGSFYPAVMGAGFVIFFIFYFFEQEQKDRESFYQSFMRPEPSVVWATILVVAFVATQATPFFSQTSKWESPLHVRAKKIPPDCQQFAISYSDKGTTYLVPQFLNKMSESFNCKPDAHFQFMRGLCKQWKKDVPGFKTFASFFLMREYGEENFKTYFQTTDICKTELDLSDVEVN